MDPLDSLRNDLIRFSGGLSDSEWGAFRGALHPMDCAAGQVIFGRQRRQLAWVFLTRGIAAAEQPETGGELSISRFFEPGQFCTNVTALSQPEETGEIVMAITAVSGVVMSDQFFQAHYRSNDILGAYLREKIMEAVLFDRELLRVKTSMNVDTRYQFLASRSIDILHRAPVVDLARFVGISPKSMQTYMQTHQHQVS